ncbi:sensor histidine kinase [Chitinophaga sp. 212800010-3]|uniref:sensor histidine kinase n=1 Tax=unclassified Chitinophaga TaxID=2619133 RepID=UPI002DE45E13|nr:histidine kinase [Chitinophaga sp. 212800010-3]
MEVSEITYLVVFGTIAFLLFFVFIGLVVIRYYKKSKEYVEKTFLLKQSFEHNLLQARLEVQEQTFNTISQEIHDNVGQLLSLAKVQLSIAEQSETADKPLLSDIKSNLSNALNDLRDIAKSLNSDRIRQLTLAQIIEEELQRISRWGSIRYHLQVSGAEQPLSEQTKTILFRVVQECFQNILKHANATQINTDLDYTVPYLHIKITDNGVGFLQHQSNEIRSGIGLNNIKTRVALINGTIHISSTEGKGAAVTLNIPYE